MSEQEAVSWVPWNDARKQVEAAGLVLRGHLPGILLDWIEAGMIEARAQTLLIDGKPANDQPIPADLWKVARKGESGLMDWRTGQFQGIVYGGGVIRKRMFYKGFGLMFRGDQLSALAPAAASAPPLTPAPASPEAVNRGGRKPSEDWPNFAAELAFYVHEVGIPDGRGTEGSESVIEAVLTRLEQRSLEGPSRSTVQPAVQKFLRWVRASK